MEWSSRTALLIGPEGQARLAASHVLVVGVGGVGGYAAELLARAGVGALTIADGDVFEESNLNRQLFSLRSTLGQPKVEVAKRRLLDINPELKVTPIQALLHDEPLNELAAQPWDLVVDAIDTLSPKAHLIRGALAAGTSVVSSMGCGARRAATRVEVSSIWEVKGDPLAAALRKRLRRLGVRGDCLAVWTPENPEARARVETSGEAYKRSRVGVISYMPAIFGAFAAAAGIEILLKGGTPGSGTP